mmetsp:Transcript_17769/g.50850  ORF Transcript_17769/g.50850 Transcript_17769/m.50850 type:complete len:234 (-) Transcript_17769:3322-4023(-)
MPCQDGRRRPGRACSAAPSSTPSPRISRVRSPRLLPPMLTGSKSTASRSVMFTSRSAFRIRSFFIPRWANWSKPGRSYLKRPGRPLISATKWRITTASRRSAVRRDSRPPLAGSSSRREVARRRSNFSSKLYRARSFPRPIFPRRIRWSRLCSMGKKFTRPSSFPARLNLFGQSSMTLCVCSQSRCRTCSTVMKASPFWCKILTNSVATKRLEPWSFLRGTYSWPRARELSIL